MKRVPLVVVPNTGLGKHPWFTKLDRATIDPEDFSGGFTTWQGTSVGGSGLTGQLAARMVADQGLAKVELSTGVKRCWSAITQELGWTP